jgi:hypothetical protein
MIQRIQSIFLLLAILCLASLYFSSITTFTQAQDLYNFSIFGLFKTQGQNLNFNNSSYLLVVHNSVIILLLCYILVQFNNRILQIKLLRFTLLITATLVAWVFKKIGAAETLLSEQNSSVKLTTNYQFGIVVPLLAIVFLILALRAIRKDDELVKSADRIR